MKESEEDKELTAERMVHKFKQKFNDQFGTIPFVRYTLKTKSTIPLNIIEDCANKVLNSLGAYYYINGISSVFHDNDVLTCRWVYYKIAIDAGYSKTKTALQIRQNAPSVSYGYGRISKLIKVDSSEKRVYESIKKEINNKIINELE